MKSFKKKPSAYAAASALAGFFIGIGLVISQYINMLFADAPSPAGPVLSGVSFSVGLMLVFFAGAELFTGNNLPFGLALAEKRFKGSDVIKILAFCWIFNLLGSFILGLLLRFSGIGGDSLREVMLQAALGKAERSVPELLLRGIFCNILVCLAVWACAVMDNAAGKAILTMFCIGTFVTTGMEHSIANMSLFSFAVLFSPETQNALIGSSVPAGGIVKNLLTVTAGNLIGGMLFVAMPYKLAQE